MRPDKKPWQVAAEADEPTLSEQDGIRYLHFDSEWIQGAMRLAQPSELVLGYTQQMMAWRLFLQPAAADRIGILGLGAGSLLRFVLRHTRARVETVERNARVIALCRACFRLSATSRSTIALTDARAWVAHPEHAGQYRALMVDLYDSGAQGPVCGDADFYRDCYRVLDDPGIMSVNLFGHHPSFAPNLSHIRAAFGPYVLCLPSADEGNTVVLAFKGEPPMSSRPILEDRAQALEARTGLSLRRWLPALATVSEWCARSQGPSCE